MNVIQPLVTDKYSLKQQRETYIYRFLRESQIFTQMIHKTDHTSYSAEPVARLRKNLLKSARKK